MRRMLSRNRRNVRDVQAPCPARRSMAAGFLGVRARQDCCLRHDIASCLAYMRLLCADLGFSAYAMHYRVMFIQFHALRTRRRNGHEALRRRLWDNAQAPSAIASTRVLTTCRPARGAGMSFACRTVLHVCASPACRVACRAAGRKARRWHVARRQRHAHGQAAASHAFGMRACRTTPCRACRMRPA